MNIIYHRNCLDGAFSSFILDLFARIVNEQEIDAFVHKMHQTKAKGIQNLMSEVIVDSEKGVGDETWKKDKIAINQDLFHSKEGIDVNAYSFFAGEFYPLNFPGKKRLLFIVDTNLVTAQNIAYMCKTHEMVIMIDHHTSFKDIQKQLPNLPLNNFLYLFDQRYCASQLALMFANHYFNLKQRVQPNFISRFEQQIVYIAANDLKQNETRQSKSFVLGWYYFEIEMSHINPNLYKRIGLMDLEYLLVKDLYLQHIQEIQKEISCAKVCQFQMAGPFKHKKCFYLEPRNPNKISDIGTILAYLSAQEGYLNLAVLALKKQYQIRVSCRSYKTKEQPMALNLAKVYGGGGHTEAAGFKLTSNMFRSQFKILSAATASTNFNLSPEQIEEIFFGKFIEEFIQEPEQV